MLNLSEQSFGPLLLGGGDAAELRVLRNSDVSPAYVNGMNDPDVRRFVSVGRGEFDEQAIRDFVEENWTRPDCLLFGLFVTGTHRGNLRLHDYDGTTVWLGIALFDRSIAGRGFGSRAISVVSGFALDRLSCLSVRAGIGQENQMSAAAFRKAGFVIVEEKPTGYIFARQRDAQPRHVADGAR